MSSPGGSTGRWDEPPPAERTGWWTSGPVRLRVIEADLTDIEASLSVLLDVADDDSTAVFEQGLAWAQVRGYTRLDAGLKWMFSQDVPVEGFAALINKPHSVKVIVTWPWAPAHLPPGY